MPLLTKSFFFRDVDRTVKLRLLYGYTLAYGQEKDEKEKINNYMASAICKEVMAAKSSKTYMILEESGIEENKIEEYFKYLLNNHRFDIRFHEQAFECLISQHKGYAAIISIANSLFVMTDHLYKEIFKDNENGLKAAQRAFQNPQGKIKKYVAAKLNQPMPPGYAKRLVNSVIKGAFYGGIIAFSIFYLLEFSLISVIAFSLLAAAASAIGYGVYQNNKEGSFLEVYANVLRVDIGKFAEKFKRYQVVQEEKELIDHSRNDKRFEYIPLRLSSCGLKGEGHSSVLEIKAPKIPASNPIEIAIQRPDFPEVENLEQRTRKPKRRHLRDVTEQHPKKDKKKKQFSEKQLKNKSKIPEGEQILTGNSFPEESMLAKLYKELVTEAEENPEKTVPKTFAELVQHVPKDQKVELTSEGIGLPLEKSVLCFWNQNAFDYPQLIKRHSTSLKELKKIFDKGQPTPSKGSGIKVDWNRGKLPKVKEAGSKRRAEGQFFVCTQFIKEKGKTHAQDNLEDESIKNHTEDKMLKSADRIEYIEFSKYTNSGTCI